MTDISGPVVQLASGKYFSLNALNVQDIHIQDIAASLSKLCRFNGHCGSFYSVAQHCCLCHDNAPNEIKWSALMHDCAEAIISDIARPVKYYIPGIKELEKAIEAPLFQRFDVKHSAVIKQIDLRALATEKRDLMPSGAEWQMLSDVDPWPKRIEHWSAARAEREFIIRAACWWEE